MTNAEKSKLQKEVVDSSPIGESGRWLLAPRVGKSRIAILDIKRIKPKSILWVTPSQELAKDEIPKEFEKWGAKRFIKNLTTSTWMSLDKVTGHYDYIVLDEEQFITLANSVHLRTGGLTCNVLRTMTGTPTKHEEKLQIYKDLNLNVLYEISINSAVDIGLLSNYNMFVVEVEMSTARTIEAGNKDNRFMTSEKDQYAYLSKVVKQAVIQKRADAKFRILNRLRAVKNSPSKLEAAKGLLERLEGRKLIFCGSIEQAEELCANTYHSKRDNKDLLAFKEGTIDDIAMVDAGGVGQTYRAIDHLIMTQVDSDKNGLTSQKLARTLLQQEDYSATIWILVLLDTQDEKWVESALENFDKEKITYIRYKNLDRVL